MAVFSLIDLEKHIILIEHYLSNNPPNEVSNQKRVNSYKQQYRELISKVKALLGEQFQTIYDTIKRINNEDARETIDSGFYDYVLPAFNDDGSHEPWGEKDVPRSR